MQGMLQYLDKGVQLLVTTNGKLQMARSDALHLYIAVWGHECHHEAFSDVNIEWGRLWSSPSGPWKRCQLAPALQLSGTLHEYG